MMWNRIAVAAAAVLCTIGLAAPAHAVTAAGTPQADFYGTCTNNSVAYWVTEPAAGFSRYDYAGQDFKIVIADNRGVLGGRQETLFAGDYRELHRYFQRDGVAKTITVSARNVETGENVKLGSHTYWCGATGKWHRHQR